MSRSRGFSDDELDDAKAWDLPFVDGPEESKDSSKTNALNRRSDWKYEPPEEEEEITPPTAEEIEAIRQAAFDEGYAEGKQKGYQEGNTTGLEEGRKKGHEEGFSAGEEAGRESGEQQIRELAEKWQQQIQQLHAPLESVTEETRQQLVHLAVTLARAVIRTEVQTSEATILQALCEGLKALPIDENRYQIQMHPDDIAMVKSHFGEQTIAEKNWLFVESPGMTQGGCEIITTQNAVDVSVKRRCRDILDKFLLDQGLGDD